MLIRFSLYGFLKNQQYYEPFIMLALLDKGHSFFAIGLLFAIREITAIILEIPSGAIADIHGRRNSLILSFTAYIVSFALLASQQSFLILALAMFCFGTGQAFRSGTHKAMIMEWLEVNERLKEKTKVYGYTRSWSKKGSALSALIAAAILFYTADYSAVFYVSIVPYLLGIINFLSYPSYLDGKQKSDTEHTTKSSHKRESLTEHLLTTIKTVRENANLQKLIVDTMSLDGAYKSLKDYIQPLLKSAAITIPVFTSYGAGKRGIILIGVVYFIFHLLESLGSRLSHYFRDRFQSDNAAVRAIWGIYLAIYLPMLILLWFDIRLIAVATFIFAGIMYNIWRPIQVGRYQLESKSTDRATILSIESQAKALSTAILTPLAGLLVDNSGIITSHLKITGHTNGELWPVVIIPLALCSAMCYRKSSSNNS